MKIVAVDIGGTAIKAGLWDGTELTDMKEWDTEASQGGAHLMERVMQLLHTYSGFDAIGISTAGEVNTNNGTIFLCQQQYSRLYRHAGTGHYKK